MNGRKLTLGSHSLQFSLFPLKLLLVSLVILLDVTQQRQRETKAIRWNGEIVVITDGMTGDKKQVFEDQRLVLEPRAS